MGFLPIQPPETRLQDPTFALFNCLLDPLPLRRLTAQQETSLVLKKKKSFNIDLHMKVIGSSGFEKYFFVGVQLTHNVTLVSGVQHRDLTSLHVMLCSPEA